MPLDYSSPASPRIHIGFRWLPATRQSRGTILAVEGGPGYASTGSEPEYLAMIGGLASTRNLLLVDLRGTGTSTPLNCPALEQAGSEQHGRRFNQLVAACGAQLNHTWRYRDGGWVHASGCSIPPTPPGTSPRCCGLCGRAGWTCTEIPTAAGSRRSSPPAIRRCCAR